MDGTATTSISAALPAVTPGLTAIYTTIKKRNYTTSNETNLLWKSSLSFQSLQINNHAYLCTSQYKTNTIHRHLNNTANYVE